MIKSITSIEIEKNDRKYSLICNNDSPLGELYDAISQMRAFVVERINQHAQAEQEASKKVEEE